MHLRVNLLKNLFDRVLVRMRIANFAAKSQNLQESTQMFVGFTCTFSVK